MGKNSWSLDRPTGILTKISEQLSVKNITRFLRVLSRSWMAKLASLSFQPILQLDGNHRHNGGKQEGFYRVQKVSIVVGVQDAPLKSVLSAIFRYSTQTRAMFSQATSALELAADCRAHQAGLIVIDARQPRGPAALDFLPVLSFYPQAHLMVFIDSASPEAIPSILDAGARGILTGDASVHEIQNAISEVTAGHVYLSRSALIGMLEVLRRTRPAEQVPFRADLPALTNRERDVVGCLRQGQSNRDIARNLGVSEAAIKGHLSRIMMKWGVYDRLQVLVAALEAGEVKVG